MRLLNYVNKLFKKITSVFNIDSKCRNQDRVHLSLDGLDITVERCFSYDKPHEVSVFVPRAELRKKIQNGNKIEEIEVILNSITIVHSPQRPSNEGEGAIPQPPELSGKEIIIK